MAAFAILHVHKGVMMLSCLFGHLERFMGQENLGLIAEGLFGNWMSSLIEQN